jgi:hypothetical protein
MKTNELKCADLRIGNWVKINLPHKSIIGKIDGLNRVKAFVEDKEGFTTLPIHDIQPIELTEDVLVKIGFEKDGNNYSLVCGDIEVGYYIDKFKQVLYINVSREKRFYKNELRSYDVKYLHQLQNAYYLLTNEELEVNL